jgi:hypothetical protein
MRHGPLGTPHASLRTPDACATLPHNVYRHNVYHFTVPPKARGVRGDTRCAARGPESGHTHITSHIASPYHTIPSRLRWQKRNVRLLAGLNKVAAPDVEKMGFDEAERFIGKHWKAWMEHEEL